MLKTQYASIVLKTQQASIMLKTQYASMADRKEHCSPRMLAMTVVTSKLQASAAIMTPPGRPSTRKLDSTCGDTPLQMAAHTDALFTSTAWPFACAPSLIVIHVANLDTHSVKSGFHNPNILLNLLQVVPDGAEFNTQLEVF